MKFPASGLPTVMSWQGFQKSFSELATSLDCSTCDEQAPNNSKEVSTDQLCTEAPDKRSFGAGICSQAMDD